MVPIGLQSLQHTCRRPIQCRSASARPSIFGREAETLITVYPPVSGGVCRGADISLTGFHPIWDKILSQNLQAVADQGCQLEGSSPYKGAAYSSSICKLHREVQQSRTLLLFGYGDLRLYGCDGTLQHLPPPHFQCHPASARPSVFG
jgi:hypothetical protein